jgi:hypothetical protein
LIFHEQEREISLTRPSAIMDTLPYEQAPFMSRGMGKLTLVANEHDKAEYHLEKPLDDDKRVARDMIEEDDAHSPAPARGQPAAK